ncbi:uncharacterized protein [Sagmatias obliquidens]|uniref:uncharacterized protein n=1 Tax=Sagmatias obliquidens TaxID=3371155 RepID=UPI000F43FFD5|nr:uncharacterized protein LOC113624399 [Lagenorhynchus obliquidens]
MHSLSLEEHSAHYWIFSGMKRKSFKRRRRCQSFTNHRKEVLVRNSELTSHHRPEEFGKGQRREETLVRMSYQPTSQSPSRWNPSRLSEACTTRKDPESERLARDSPETNPITVKPETVSHVESSPPGSPHPPARPPGRPCPVESLALPARVSPPTIQFRVLDEPSPALEGVSLPAAVTLVRSPYRKDLERSVCREVRMSPDKRGKSRAASWSFQSHAGRRGEALSREKLSAAPTRKVMGKMLGNTMKNYMVLFIRLPTSLLPSGLCYFHPVSPTAPLCPLLSPDFSFPRVIMKGLLKDGGLNQHSPLCCQLKKNVQP